MNLIDKKYIVAPSLIGLMMMAIIFRKLMIPFASNFTAFAFEAFIAYYIILCIQRDPSHRGDVFYDLSFILLNLVYALWAFAVLSKLQYWSFSDTWMKTASITLCIYSVILLIATRFRSKSRDGERKLWKSILSLYVPLLYFLILIPICTFTNPRQFHNLFNGDTYEQYIRMNYGMADGTLLLEKYKPHSKAAKEKAVLFAARAKEMEAKEEYTDALRFYNKSIDLNPDDAQVIYQRGFLKLVRLDISKEVAQDAYDDFCRAIQLNPNLAMAYYHRAVAESYMYPGRLEQPKEDLQKAMSLDTSLSKDPYLQNFFKEKKYEVDTTSYPEYE